MPCSTELPSWTTAVVEPGVTMETDTALLDATIALAVASARNGGGPFGALVADEDGQVIAIGWNQVIQAHDSTAHAEIVALRTAQQILATHDLGEAPVGPLTLFSSCAPCIQCFGALWWSGVGRVVWAASPSDAERLGFQEGPVDDRLWAIAAERKGIEHEAGARSTQDPSEPFTTYEQLGGERY